MPLQNSPRDRDCSFQLCTFPNSQLCTASGTRATHSSRYFSSSCYTGHGKTQKKPRENDQVKSWLVCDASTQGFTKLPQSCLFCRLNRTRKHSEMVLKSVFRCKSKEKKNIFIANILSPYKYFRSLSMFNTEAKVNELLYFCIPLKKYV